MKFKYLKKNSTKCIHFRPKTAPLMVQIESDCSVSILEQTSAFRPRKLIFFIFLFIFFSLEIVQLRISNAALLCPTLVTDTGNGAGHRTSLLQKFLKKNGASNAVSLEAQVASTHQVLGRLQQFAQHVQDPEIIHLQHFSALVSEQQLYAQTPRAPEAIPYFWQILAKCNYQSRERTFALRQTIAAAWARIAQYHPQVENELVNNACFSAVWQYQEAAWYALGTLKPVYIERLIRRNLVFLSSKKILVLMKW